MQKRKPVMDYLEFNLVDHCNFSCVGCATFSPLAKAQFIDLDILTRDLTRLGELFSEIKFIRMLGGEPLLHPSVASICHLVRIAFPKADIRILTNGMLLDRLGCDFWESMREDQIGLDISLYPPNFSAQQKHVDVCQQELINVRFTFKKTMKRIINIGGDSSPEAAFAQCAFKVSTFLYKGRIAPCSLPLTAHIFNAYFKENISCSGSIGIHDPEITGEDILTFIGSPTDSCRFCSLSPERYAWTGPSQKKINEWVTGEYIL